MNQFEFFRAAALRHMGKDLLTHQDQLKIDSAFKNLRIAFSRNQKIDYSSEYTRLAYMFHYAPKHAIIWREYFRTRNRIATGSWSVNSLGPACGAEIIGIMEGLHWKNPGIATWNCFDTEPHWQPMIEAVECEYLERHGAKLKIKTVQNIEELRKHTFTIGSMILSEIIKQNDHRSFRPLMTRLIGPSEGMFLDITRFRLDDGTEDFVSNMFPFGYENLKQSNVFVKDVINAEMDDCNPCYCKYRLPLEPSMNMFFAKFEN